MHAVLQSGAVAMQAPLHVLAESDVHWSQVVLNVVQSVVFLGGCFALFRWWRERQDRSTTVLFELEDRFSKKRVRRFRGLLDDEERFEPVGRSLFDDVCSAVAPEYAKRTKWLDGIHPPEGRDDDARLDADAFLRFYVVLRGVLLARQTSEKTLRAVFRYYLCQVGDPKRWPLRCYVHTYYPTLREWLRESAQSGDRGFFRPEEFGWRPLREFTDEEAIREIRRRSLKRVLVITGAGISRASGVPTFREVDRYWELSSTKALAERPAEALRRFHDRRVAIGTARPNPGHTALGRLATNRDEEGASRQDLLLVTQNVDDLHERGGFPADRTLHVHGTLTRDRCPACPEAHGEDALIDVPGGLVHYAREAPPDDEATAFAVARHLHTCGRTTRPDVVLFDEDERHGDEVSRFLEDGPCDLVLVVGTLATFDYVGSWVARAAGTSGLIVEVNPSRTAISGLADHVFDKESETWLPKILGT